MLVPALIGAEQDVAGARTAEHPGSAQPDNRNSNENEKTCHTVAHVEEAIGNGLSQQLPLRPLSRHSLS